MARYIKGRRKVRKLRVNISKIRIIRRRETRKLLALGVIFIFGLIMLILILRLIFGLTFNIKISQKDVEAMKIPAREITWIYEICAERQLEPQAALTAYLMHNRFFKEKQSAKTKEQLLMDFFPKMEAYRKRIPEKQFNEYLSLIETIFAEMKRFPILSDSEPQYMFGDTWSAKRDMCGTKTHAGCDIFDRENIPGRLLVVSMSNGTVEAKGRNGRGGAYVGIRTERGSYYLYDNLEKITDVELGTAVVAGSPIGYMGNGGRTDNAPVKGNYPTSVHIGAKIKLGNKEIWINTYPFLRFLEDKTISEQAALAS